MKDALRPGHLAIRLILAAVLLSGCGGSSEPEKIVEPAEITTMGFIRDSVTLVPIPRVAVYRDSLFMGVSDTTGYYTAPVGYPPIARWELVFSKTGYRDEVFELPAEGVQDSVVSYFWHLDVLLTRIE